MVIEDKLFEVRNISFSYGGEEIFSDISFSIDKGDVLCLLGPNGTGKTTLIKCLNGLNSINSGEILINGQNIKKMSFKEISKHIGYIPQSHVPSFPFKVFDVVLMGRAPYLNLTDSPKKEDRKIALDSLKILGIEDLKDKQYTNLSGGERQLVFLARVLCQKPDILILDEPTSHLDFGNQIKFLEIVDNLAKSGLSIIMSSHFPDHAFLSSTKVAILKEGRFIDFGNPDDVVSEKNLKKAYSIDVKLMELDDKRKVCVPIKTNLKLDLWGDMMNEKDYDEQLAKAGEFHGHICGGIAIGTKLAMYGLELLGMPLNERHKNLIVFLEIDRCMSDAVQSVTGCSMGKRTLKQMYYGKFAATFYNQDTGEALRITDADANKKFKDEETKEEMIERFRRTPPEELFRVDKVKIELSRGDMPGKPYTTAFCCECGEKVSDGRHILKGGKPYCRSCAEGSYYELIEE